MKTTLSIFPQSFRYIILNIRKAIISFPRIFLASDHLSYAQSQRYKVLQYSFMITSVVAALLGLINLDEHAYNYALFLFVCSGVDILGLLLNYRGKYLISAGLLSVEIFTAIIYTLIDGAGFSDSGIAAFPILIVFSTFILGRNGLIASFGGSILSIAGLYFLNQTGLLILHNKPSIPRVLVLFILIVMISIIVWIVLDMWEKSFLARDIVEAKLIESEARFRTLAQATFEGIVISKRGVVIDANDQFAAMHGYPLEEVIGKSILDFFSPEEQTRVKEVIDQGEERLPEYHGVRKDRSQFIAEGQSRVLEFNQEMVRITSVRDLTAHKQAEEALRKSDEKFSKAVYGSTAGLALTVMGEGRFIDVNNAFLKIIGYNRDEVIGRTSLELGLWDDPIEQARLLEEMGKLPIMKEKEVHIRSKDRGLVICNATFQDILIDNTPCIITTISDITEQKQSEERLRLELARSNALARTAAILNSRLEMDFVLQSICQEIVRVIKIPAVAILLYEPELDVCALAAYDGLPPDFGSRFKSFPRKKDIGNQASQYPVVFTNIQNNPNFVNAKLCADYNICKVITTGIYHQDQFLGIVECYCFDAERVFDESEISLLKTLTNLGAQAIINARLYREILEGREHLREVSQQLVDAQEAERRSMALELHDELGQVLNGIKISLDMIPMIHDPPAREQLLDKARTAIGKLIEQTRQMSLELRPSLLDEMGLFPTLKWFFRDYQEHTQAPVEFKWNGPEIRLPPSIEITAYRIVQESLNNVVRHVNNKQVAVSVWVDTDNLKLQIEDHGEGFDPQEVLIRGRSTGLSGMRERARLLGGELKIESMPRSGTRISATIPVIRSL